LKNPEIKPGRALICGSMAFDTIMVFQDHFRNHILPDKLHMLNVSFLALEMRREFGGCAGNIAYNLKLLGDRGYVMATVGHDFGPYAQWMDQNGVPRDYIRVVTAEHTGQAFITTDLDNNQITAFHPGAMGHSHLNKVEESEGVSIGIVAPDGRDGMIQHATQFAAKQIPFIFDPGQGLPMFNGEELRAFIAQASWVAVNDYEGGMLAERTGQSLEEIAAQVEALIVTRGGAGSWIYAKGARHEIPPARPARVADPTGCGDAYRAGLLFGLQRQLDWATTGRIASLAGAIKIEQHGTQQHTYDWAGFAARFRDNFGYAL